MTPTCIAYDALQRLQSMQALMTCDTHPQVVRYAKLLMQHCDRHSIPYVRSTVTRIHRSITNVDV